MAAPADFDPDAYLDSLEPVGWRLGLERMRTLTTALGLPQHRFASVHVVGTNGKSSVTRMTAALLEAHGLRGGACLSPHADRWSERTLIGGAEIAPEAWADAVLKVANAAAGVNRGLDDGDAVTEFEAATAATFVALANARVEVAAIEAGLGGRLDATNTIPSRITVLTSVGLDHTEWLGETELEIAAEKLAVLRDHTTLVLGRVSGGVRALAERVAAERAAELVPAPEDPGEGIELAATGGFQRRNFALAMAAARAFLGELDTEAVARTAATRPRPRPAGADRRRAADLRRRRPQPRRRRRPGRGAAGARRGAPGGRLPGGPRRQGRRGDDRGARPGSGVGGVHGIAQGGARAPRPARRPLAPGRRAGGPVSGGRAARGRRARPRARPCAAPPRSPAGPTPAFF